jgi:glycosyltransferase involved in cell wall biosynthesis
MWTEADLVKDEARLKKKLMWIAPSPLLQSSFSVVSNQLLQRIHGYKILYVAQNYNGTPQKIGNYTLAPYSAGDHILYYHETFKPDKTVFFQSPGFLVRLSPILPMLKKQTEIILYTPIEGYPMLWEIDPLFSTANKILVPSQYSQECLSKHGYTSEVLHHAVDTSVFKPAQKPETFTVGAVASDVWRKQLPRIIDAHQLVINMGFKVECLIVASTYDSTPWQPQIKEYAKITNPTVMFNELAYLNLPASQKEIAEHYNKFHILLQPSTEAFGLTCLEAMASGTVPIIINHGASPEVVADCGVYAAIKDYLHMAIGKIALVDSKDLAEKIVWAMEHPTALHELAVKGLTRAKKFNWPNATQRLEELLAN